MALTAAQIQALKAELTNDPRGYGYAAALAVSDQAAAGLVNVVRDGTNGGPAINVRRADITPAELLEAIDLRDFPATPAGVTNQALAAAWLESVMQFSAIPLLAPNGTNNRIRTNLNRLLDDTQGSQTRLTAISRRLGTRGEELFGQGTVVTAADVDAARNLP